MKAILVTAILLSATATAANAGEFDPSDEHPFGRINPAGPEELNQFAFALGRWSCELGVLIDGEWRTEPLSWTFKTTLNGMAFNDNSEGSMLFHSLRQFDPATKTWKHTFHGANRGFERHEFEGTYQDGKMVLESEHQTAADGTASFTRFVFQDITANSYEWKSYRVSGGEAANNAYISCRRAE